MEERVIINPNICHGKPVIKGTRIPVHQILSSLAAGDSIQDILREYPNLKDEDIKAALAFGSRMTKFDNFCYDQIHS